jgi:ferredoxin--NADP+ reductase
MTSRARPRVAIVGAGPSGAFAAACLLRAHPDVDIDLFDRLPTPWGLLRGGVAPDHQEIKRLADAFERDTLHRGCRFLGNVEVGVDVSHAELMGHFDAVVYATGAQADKSLGIPGEAGRRRSSSLGTTAIRITGTSSSTSRRNARW